MNSSSIVIMYVCVCVFAYKLHRKEITYLKRNSSLINVLHISTLVFVHMQAQS